MRDRQVDDSSAEMSRRPREQLAAELRALRELNRRRGELLATALAESRGPLQALRRLGDLLALPDRPAERVREVAAEVQRAAMQLENILTDLEHAAHLPSGSPRLRVLPGPEISAAELRGALVAERERGAVLEAELAAARLAQEQLQSYADDFRRIYAESRQRLQHLAALYDVSTAIAATVDPQEVLERTAEGLVRLLPDAELAIYLLEDGGRLATRRPIAGVPDSTSAPTSLEPGEGLVGQCLASGQIQAEGQDEDGRPIGEPPRRLAIPFGSAPGLLGALLLSRERGDPFDREERHLAELVATQTAMALQNAHLATTDALTGLYNRRYFEKALAYECERARRVRRPVGLLIADVDHFKRFNERFGHPAGDAVLREVASTLATHLRRTDIVARVGGEEFAAILPEDNVEAVAVAAERLRRAVEQRPSLRFDGRELPPVRISIGGASLLGEAVDSEALIRAADDALRRAKRGGRNRSLVAGLGDEPRQPRSGESAPSGEGRP